MRTLTIVPTFNHYLQCASPAATRGQRRFCLAAASANSSRCSRDGQRQHFKGTTQGFRLQGDVISPKMSYNRPNMRRKVKRKQLRESTNEAIGEPDRGVHFGFCCVKNLRWKLTQRKHADGDFRSFSRDCRH